ncbi:HAMP domain-containing protein [Candidatus Woesearchaeota archaeon]|nr:HAMP domain-containing protein [Candidatus Woesearchaeota archaeon]
MIRKKRTQYNSKLSIKIFSVLLLILLVFSFIAINSSVRNAKNLAASIKKNSEDVVKLSVIESSKVLNDQAKEYLIEIVEQKAYNIKNHIIKIRENVLALTTIEKNSESYLTFYNLHKAKIHNKLDSAPKESVSFPNEQDILDIEVVSAFKALTYIDEFGMEQIKVENSKIVAKSDLQNVKNTQYYIATKNLANGKIYVQKKEYVIWDCTKRESTIIGEPLYKNTEECPDTNILALNVTDYKRFTQGYIRYATPVYANDSFKGIVVADVDFLSLMKLINNVKIKDTGYAYLQQTILDSEYYIAGQGITLAHPSHQFVLNMDPATLYKIDVDGLEELRILSEKQQIGETGIGQYVFRGIDKYTAYASYVEDNNIIWSVGITSPVSEFTATSKTVEQKVDELLIKLKSEIDQRNAKSLFTLLNILIILMVVIFFSIIVLLNTFVIKPIVKLRSATEKISKGQYETIDVKSQDEIGLLSDSLNNMIEDLKIAHVKSEEHSKILAMEVTKSTATLRTKITDLENSRSAMLNILEDVSEEKEIVQQARESVESLNNQLEEANKELMALDRQKDQFTSITAHELKTPLASIHGFIQLLQDKKVFSDEKKRTNYMSIILQDTERLSRLITDILDVSRLDLGTLKFYFEKINLRNVFDTIKREMSSLAKTKNMTIQYNVKKNIPKTIIGDKARIAQVLINLISNAIHYTPQNGKILVNVKKQGADIIFSVADSGIGIEKEQQTKIFDRFYQVDSWLTRKISGSGLGLAICKGLVTAMNGKISVKSKKGKGSTFYFVLPTKGKIKHVDRYEKYLKVFDTTLKHRGLKLKKGGHEELRKELGKSHQKKKLDIARAVRRLHKKELIEPINEKVAGFFE